MLEVADILRLHGLAYRERLGNRLLASQERSTTSRRAGRRTSEAMSIYVINAGVILPGNLVAEAM